MNKPRITTAPKTPDFAGARKALGLTWAEFARLIGCNPATLWRWSCGATSRSNNYRMAARIARRGRRALAGVADSVRARLNAGRPINALILAAGLNKPN